MKGAHEERQVDELLYRSRTRYRKRELKHMGKHMMAKSLSQLRLCSDQQAIRSKDIATFLGMTPGKVSYAKQLVRRPVRNFVP